MKGLWTAQTKPRSYHAASTTCFLANTTDAVVFAHNVNRSAGLPLQTFIIKKYCLLRKQKGLNSKTNALLLWLRVLLCFFQSSSCKSHDSRYRNASKFCSLLFLMIN
jgi:hypothetical protein